MASGSKQSGAGSPEPEQAPVPAPHPVVEVPSHRAAHDFPSLMAWLRSCEDDLVRGRDSHAYTDIEGVFVGNGFTRVDDIVMLSPEAIFDLAKRENVNITLALAHRVFRYAKEDVQFVQSGGKLS